MSPRDTNHTDHDVVIVGDGPAGRALGAECVAAGVDAVVVGAGQPWSATYGAWADEVAAHHVSAGAIMDIDVVGTPPRRRLQRQYLVFDNPHLEARLDTAPRLVAQVRGVQHHVDGSVVLVDDDRIAARFVVDATGPTAHLLARRSGAGPSFQSAYGLVLDGRPNVGGDAAVLMDWRAPSPDARAEPTFLYLVQLGSGRWLVEETSLARRRPMPVDELRRRLAARLGRDLTDQAEHVEHVVIPMWPGVPARSQPTVGFGAAGGYIHPATGYSLTASLQAAPRVAAALHMALGNGDSPAAGAQSVWDAVWPADARRARVLHDFGQAALLRLGAHEVQAFFDAFFELPTDWWSAYLRVDTKPAEVARVMSAVFSAVPWSVRRRLVAGNPKGLARLLR